MRVVHLDAFSGVSGDMFLGAVVDAGVPIEVVNNIVASLNVPGLSLSSEPALRGSLSCTRVVVTAPADAPHRGLPEILELLARAGLPEEIEEDAAAVFRRLAEVEGALHGVDAEEVHFHEVGAGDAIADVVGTVCGLAELGVRRFTVGPINVGGGLIGCAHGTLPVPAPATLRLLEGWSVYSEGPHRELTTPTGAALVSVLGTQRTGLPPLTVERDGYGAGGSDPADWPNALRVIVGTAAGTSFRPCPGRPVSA